MVSIAAAVVVVISVQPLACWMPIGRKLCSFSTSVEVEEEREIQYCEKLTIVEQPVGWIERDLCTSLGNL